jgi:hypothetical protein
MNLDFQNEKEKPMKLWHGFACAVGIMSLYFSCEKKTVDIGGSVTETQNVAGVVVGKNQEPVAGAKLSLFKKKSTITTPDETVTPYKETRSDENGEFGFDADDGNYTMVAAADSNYAFLDNITPGTKAAKDLRAELGNPGGLKGTIANSLELRGTGSVVVHLIGTDLFQNVSDSGSFYIATIPAGTYTLVSYSTYQQEFSPQYQQVTIYPDSITNLGTYSLPYNGIPIPRNVSVKYDTVSGKMMISWNSIPKYADFQEYAVLRGVTGQKNHNLSQIGYTQDTFFIDSVDLKPLPDVKYEYAVFVRNKLGEEGKYYGIYSQNAVYYADVIPSIDSLNVKFDTLNGLVHLEWDSVKNYEPLGGYLIIRHIGIERGSERGVIKTDTLCICKNIDYIDSLFPKALVFSDSNHYSVYYSAQVYNQSWKRFGKPVLSDTIALTPYKKLVPVVKNLSITYDTTKGVATVSWDSLNDMSAIEGFRVLRNIRNSGMSLDKYDTMIVKFPGVKDTIYPAIVPWDTLTPTTVCYSISVKNKVWGIDGEPKTVFMEVQSYKAYKPQIEAGADQVVELNTQAALKGIVISSRFPIAKMEWKVGDGDWKQTTDGTDTFTTKDDFTEDTIPCIFRVMDAMGNGVADSLTVRITVLLTSYVAPPSQPGSPTLLATLGERCYAIGYNDFWRVSIWSTNDFSNWKVEKENILTDFPSLVCSFKNRIYSFTYSNDWYFMSSNGLDWDTLTNNLDSMNFWGSCSFNVVGNYIYHTSRNLSNNHACAYRTEDGILWNQIDTNSIPEFCLDSKVARYSNQKFYVSSDAGATWEEDGSWYKGYGESPDNLVFAYSDSALTVVKYGNWFGMYSPNKARVYRHGTWNNIPLNSSDVAQPWGSPVFIGNRLYFLTSTGQSSQIKSIKLR